jgi:hypothetical protein
MHWEIASLNKKNFLSFGFACEEKLDGFLEVEEDEAEFDSVLGLM